VQPPSEAGGERAASPSGQGWPRATPRTWWVKVKATLNLSTSGLS